MIQRYKSSSPDALVHHPLDDMTLIFQKTSGITHVVADPVPAILAAMGEKPVSAAEVAQKLSADYDLEQGVDVEDVVLARLEELCTLGLVERVAG